LKYRVKLGILEKDSVYGYVELLSNSSIRINRVTAIEDSVVLGLSEERFREYFSGKSSH
jgi:CRP-like cAMP-binding protein